MYNGTGIVTHILPDQHALRLLENKKEDLYINGPNKQKYSNISKSN